MVDKELAEIARTLEPLPFPKKFAVEVTGECNLACIMCHHPSMQRPKGRMPFELWMRCADQIAEISPDTECWFSFIGEPLLEPELVIKMVEYGKSMGLSSLNVNTNGMPLTPDIAEPLMDAGVDLVVVGIDGFTAAVCEAIRIGADRDTVYANVENFLKVRFARETGPEVQVQFVEMDENSHELDAFQTFWLELGAVVKTRRMLSWGGQFDVSFNAPENRIPCPWAITMMHVFWDGRVPRCPGDTEGEEGVGNAWDAPLAELWGRLGSYRQTHLEHRWDDLPDRCHTCTDWATGAAARIRPSFGPLAASSAARFRHRTVSVK